MKEIIIKILENINNESLKDEDLEFIKSKIRTIPDWPKRGIMFRDITTLLKDSKAFEKTIDMLYQRYKSKEIDSVLGIESRGFIIASALASKLGKGLILARKPGKLPAASIKQSYYLEYGQDAIEVHADSINKGQKILIVDDLIATGGTVSAAAQ